MNVAVIGSGPAGLLAAEAARAKSCNVQILAKPGPDYEPMKSRIAGAQYLHERIPHLTNYDPDFYIEVVKLGTAEGYAEKVYGDVNAPTSWGKYEDGARLPAWSLSTSYEILYKRFYPDMTLCHVDRGNIEEIIGSFDLVINTAPLRDLCSAGHDFKYQPVWITSRRSDDHAPLGGRSLCEMVYSGRPDEHWYRFSMIEGQCFWEYATNYDFDRVLHKPTVTNCDCYPGVMRAGRHGCWDKEQLTHHAYNKVLERIDAMLRV